MYAFQSWVNPYPRPPDIIFYSEATAAAGDTESEKHTPCPIYSARQLLPPFGEGDARPDPNDGACPRPRFTRTLPSRLPYGMA